MLQAARHGQGKKCHISLLFLFFKFHPSNHILHVYWASPVAQLVKNLPAMQETWVQSLGWEDPLEKGKYSGLENLWVTKSQTGPSNFHFHSEIYTYFFVI